MAVRTTLTAASIIALSFFFVVTGIFAANSDAVYQSIFKLSAPQTGDFAVHFKNSALRPTLVMALDGQGSQWTVPFELSNREIVFSIGSRLASQITIFYSLDSGTPSAEEFRTMADERQMPGQWDPPAALTSGVLVNVTDSLLINSVGVADTHTLSFTTSTAPVADSGAIWAVFPAGFDISGVANAIYYDNDPANDGNEPGISGIIIGETSVEFHFDSTGQQAVAGSRISVRFWPVINDTTLNSHSLVVITTKADGQIDNGPAQSARFQLNPGPLYRILIEPSAPLTVASDSTVFFNAAGNDRYGNIIDNLVFTYAVTVDSCGDIVGGSFRAVKLGATYITASTGGLTDSSGLVTVVPGPLERFTMTGYPSSRIAGQAFPLDVVVTALDHVGNKKYDYLGPLWFSTTDTIDDLPYEAGNPYNFAPSDSGSKIFSGSGFVLKRIGLRTLTATNGTVGITSNPIRVNAAIISSFNLSVISPQTAGESFTATVSNAIDGFGNAASGEIIVADTVGGGNSPNGIPPSLNRIMVNGGAGTALQTLTNAVPTILKGILSGGSASAITQMIEVLPSEVGRFQLTGFPSGTVAGDTLPPGITVDIYDIFGNRKTNYDNWVYFTSRDTLAILPYSQLAPFHFSILFSGHHVFNEPFSLRTGGSQYISFTDSVLSVTSPPIAVAAGNIDAFTISAPLSVTAGEAFAVDVGNCADSWGNLASGTVLIADSLGGGPSPGGNAPIYSPVQVTQGQGSSGQILFNAVPTVLKGTSGSIIAISQSIGVAAGSLGSFDFAITSPQTNGIPFYGTAALTAYDLFGNLKRNFDASANNVTITSSAIGDMTNNVLALPGDFSQGVADLVARGTTYNGRGGAMNFIASAQSGVIATSNLVEMNALVCEDLVYDEFEIVIGDTITGAISLINQGGTDAAISSLSILESGGWTTHPLTSPDLPDSLGPGQSRNYRISFPIPLEFGPGYRAFTAAVQGLFSSFVVADTIGGFNDTLLIISTSHPEYVSNTLSPETLSTGSSYSLSFRLSNTGLAGLALSDTSYLEFTDGAHYFRANITDAEYLPPDSPGGIPIYLDSTIVDPAFGSGLFPVVFHYFGAERGQFRQGSLAFSDQIAIQYRAVLGYVVGSINADSLVPGQGVAFSMQIQNSGNADFLIHHQGTRIAFGDGQREYISYSDTSAPNRVDVLPPGITTFHFNNALLPPDLLPGTYLPSATISGFQNGHDEVITFNTIGDSIHVVSRAAVRIDSTTIYALNAPFVNTAQPCSIKVIVENLGDEAAESLYVHIGGDGQSVFPESLLVERLDGRRGRTLTFNGIAAANPNEGEIFTSAISGGIGHIGRGAVSYRQALDNFALMVIETPAALSLDSVSVISPPEALDDTISVNQVIRISTQAHNAGQAGIVGARQLWLNVGDSGFNTADSIHRDYELDAPVYWDIIAPGSPSDSAAISINFWTHPLDQNDGSATLTADSIATRVFTIDLRPYIRHNAAITGPSGAMDGILSAGQTFVLTDTLRPSGIYRDLAVRINLPQGFSANDSIIKYPSGNIVSWNIRASQDTADQTISLISWVYDVNTPDSSVSPYEFIPITMVNAAALRLSSAIVGPPRALDGIAEPGGRIVYEALVENVGDAAVNSGRVRLFPGRNDFIPDESYLRDFTADVPVLWNINLPDSEISQPVSISAVIEDVPLDENSGNPARIIVDSSSVQILIKELLPRLIVSNIQGHSGSVVKGQEFPFLGFTLENSDFGGEMTIALAGFTVNIASHPGASVAELISSATIESDSGVIAADYMADDIISFPANDTIYLAPLGRITFRLNLLIRPNTAVTDFTISLADNFVSAVALEENLNAGPILPVTSRGEPISWEGEPAAVLEQTFSGSISSYPNPFNPRVQGARIGYYLPSSADLEIRIFTLFGELVWTKNIAASDALGQSGLHTGQSALIWDGKNDTGREIRSGVYICMIKNLTTGEEEKFKIAIVK